jgi:hypothetical protein
MIRQQFLYQGRQRTSIIGRRPLGGLFQLGIDAHVKLRRFSLDHLGQSNRFALGSQYYVLTFAFNNVYTLHVTPVQRGIVETALITIAETLPGARG